MVKEKWVTAAMTNDAMVAELLIRMKQSSSLDSSATDVVLLPTVRWGHRKSRSRPSAIATTTAATATGLRKEHQSGSPTTPLYWSSGGGASTSDGYDESSRPSDLSSGGRSTKGGLGNEGASATTSSYKKSRKRKSFAELKEEEDFLLKEKLHLNRELESMRLTMNKQIATSHNLKKFKINFQQIPKTEMEKSATILENQQDKGFFLPDLNMAPDTEEL